MAADVNESGINGTLSCLLLLHLAPSLGPVRGTFFFFHQSDRSHRATITLLYVTH